MAWHGLPLGKRKIRVKPFKTSDDRKVTRCITPHMVFPDCPSTASGGLSCVWTSNISSPLCLRPYCDLALPTRRYGVSILTGIVVVALAKRVLRWIPFVGTITGKQVLLVRLVQQHSFLCLSVFTPNIWTQVLLLCMLQLTSDKVHVCCCGNLVASLGISLGLVPSA